MSSIDVLKLDDRDFKRSARRIFGHFSKCDAFRITCPTLQSSPVCRSRFHHSSIRDSSKKVLVPQRIENIGMGNLQTRKFCSNWVFSFSHPVLFFRWSATFPDGAWPIHLCDDVKSARAPCSLSSITCVGRTVQAVMMRALAINRKTVELNWMCL